MMHYSYFSAQEIGPDEDHQIQSPRLQKVLEEEDLCYGWNRGIFGVEKNNTSIDVFLDKVPMLVRQDGTYGLIWNKSLQPSDGRYEPGEHFCRTREPERKSANGSVSFYRDGETGQKFAIKTLQDSDHFHGCEIKIGLVCDSPNLCSVYGIIIRDHRIHILLEHAGSELTKERSWIAESADRILTFAKQSFKALQELHRCGYVHCDIKPDNIMIVRDQGEDFTVKVVDFGSCQLIGCILPPDAHTTRFYWSPEIWQSLSKGDQVVCQPAMDVYALALTLFFVQTSSHLMNMLQEKDILPLMTQKSEDLLLIALPETIPSGLRAVMRPCLAGRTEERWSAQQAASQLDGDAMMQKALSNPKGENYKDWFQQLMQSRFEKNLSKQSGSIAARSFATTSKQQTFITSTKTETQGTQRDHSPIHFFVGSGMGNEKPELGLNLKPACLKGGVEKKQAPPVKAKRSGSLNSGKRLKASTTKPRRIVMKAMAAPKVNQPHNRSTQPDLKNEPEVLYISSDETTLCPAKQKQKRSPSEKMDTGQIEPFPVKKSVDMGVQQDKIGVRPAQKQPSQTTEGFKMRENCFTNPGSGWDPGSGRGEKPRVTAFSQLDPGERAFSCSALLVTLATQARSFTSNKDLVSDQSVTAALPTSYSVSQMFERDKKILLPASPYLVLATRPSKANDNHEQEMTVDDQFKNKIYDNLRDLKITQAQEYSSIPADPGNQNTALDHTCHQIKGNTTQAQSLDNQQLKLVKTARVQEEKVDEMDFVFQALEVPQFTGRAEDILDNLCNLLDKDEQKSVSGHIVPKPTRQKYVFTHQAPGTVRLACSVDKEEPMDTRPGISLSAGPTGTRSQGLPHQANSRKRILNSEQGSIPAKIIARHSEADVSVTKRLLPNFDEILPEKI